jgi:hypothetical protein
MKGGILHVIISDVIPTECFKLDLTAILTEVSHLHMLNIRWYNMQLMLGSNEYDSEIQCNHHGTGVFCNKNFITVMTITGTVNVVKVADLETPFIKYGVFITSDSKIVVIFSHKCTCTFAPKLQQVVSKGTIYLISGPLLSMREAENLYSIV